MTTYQETSYYPLDSPLNRPEDEAYWWTGSSVPRMPDPIIAVQQRMILILAAVFLFIIGFGYLAVRGNAIGSETQPQSVVAQEGASEHTDAAGQEVAVIPSINGIAPLFTKEVQHWAPQIVAWANEFGIDPNMAATVMQIESCGDPNAVSGAGAQGLFQVMPFHFEPGEAMQDPTTNARRGMAYLALGMQQTNGDANRTFAGYNGGHGTAARSWDTWPAETQRYYVWATGIYKDAVAGSAGSETLNQWLAAGGASLCGQAAARLGIQ